MYYCTSRNKTTSRPSIIARLSFRSLTGQGLGLDVHKCSISRNRLYWNMSSITGCYLNYIGRYEVDFHVSNQCLSLFENFGLVGACSCCYDCKSFAGDGIGKVCIYTDPRVLEYPLHLRKHFCCWGWDDGTCQCPGISFWIVCAMWVWRRGVWRVPIWQFQAKFLSNQKITRGKTFWNWY